MTDAGKPFKQTYAGAPASQGKEIRANEDKEKLSTSEVVLPAPISQKGKEILEADEHQEKLSTSIACIRKVLKRKEPLDDVTTDELKILGHGLSHYLKRKKKQKKMLQNPQNWPSDKRILLYCEVSNRLDDLSDSEYHGLWAELGKIEVSTIGEGEGYKNPLRRWDERIGLKLLKEMKKRSKYKYNFMKVQSLVRFIRNLNTHHGKLPKDIQPSVMPYERMDEYFTKRFPRLLAEVYKAVSKTCKEKDCFDRYFD